MNLSYLGNRKHASDGAGLISLHCIHRSFSCSSCEELRILRSMLRTSFRVRKSSRFWGPPCFCITSTWCCIMLSRDIPT
ncbi:uncharacterized protein DS421_14g447120 [Arachis hypogaea]|nr:uncharacterized protein DS421_14g447120 [Arachis hypogaea]